MCRIPYCWVVFIIWSQDPFTRMHLKGHNMHFEAHYFISGNYKNKFEYFTAVKHISCLVLSTAAAPSQTLFLSSCLFKTQSPLIGLLTHAWPSITINNRAAVWNLFLHTKLTDPNVWLHDVKESTAGRPTRRSRSSVFGGREEFPVGVDFQDLLQSQELIKKQKKSIIILL